MDRISRFVLAVALIVGLSAMAWAQDSSSSGPVLGPNTQAQVTQPDQGGVNWKGVGVGAGTVAGNVVYIPAKLAYGILGGIAGGAGYVLTGGNKQVANTIWRSSLGGDYVLTPDMVSGKEGVHFSGPTNTEPATSSSPGSPLPPAADSGASGMNTASNASEASNAMPPSSPGANGAAPVTESIDSGAGPVQGANPPPAPDAGVSAAPAPARGASRDSTSKPKAPPLPDTSIE